MANITIDNLQPMVEYEELSGSELESVTGGWFATLIADFYSVVAVVGIEAAPAVFAARGWRGWR